MIQVPGQGGVLHRTVLPTGLVANGFRYRAASGVLYMSFQQVSAANDSQAQGHKGAFYSPPTGLAAVTGQGTGRASQRPPNRFGSAVMDPGTGHGVMFLPVYVLPTGSAAVMDSGTGAWGGVLYMW
ncbi:hypothetical protein AVEN_54031-1 [Araneus ventricosus]|uniref:Uncharacterized protein n=1 Tax=Araneus ventricosus TaxID=182803 RepID=A0A4Y2R7M8_ARAVE|nr:hypothetical protein AVEN_54031-1 [Araneus ventricosus]